MNVDRFGHILASYVFFLSAARKRCYPVRNRKIVFVAVIFFSIVIMIPARSVAQMFSSGVGIKTSGETGGARIVKRSYPKRFEITGLVELIYTDYSFKWSSHGRKSENDYATFEQRYNLGVKGFIYDPRLATFSAKISYDIVNTDYKNQQTENKYKNMFYYFDAQFLPGRPLNIDVYFAKSNGDMQAFGTPQDFSNNAYGASLIYRNKNLPALKLQYEHWDYSTEITRGRRDLEAEGVVAIKKRIKINITNERFTARISGYSKPLRTRYVILGEFSEFSSNLLHYNKTYVRSLTQTVLKKDTEITTNFQYTQESFYKLLDFNASLMLSPIKDRIYQTYDYEYYNSESGQLKSSDHNFSGTWRYRFSRQFGGIANARYRFGEKNNASEQYYYLNIGLNYIKDLKGYILKSKYTFTLGNLNQSGSLKYMQNYLDCEFITKPYKWGKILLGYYFRYRMVDSNFGAGNTDTSDMDMDLSDVLQQQLTRDMENILRMRINGRGPMRVFWTLELEGRHLDSSDIEGAGWRHMWMGDVPFGSKIRYYTASGEVGYPIGWRATTNFRASYTTGTNDSVPVKRYMYEGRLRYYVFRNMNVSALFREEFYNAGWRAISPLTQDITKFDTRIRDYEVTLSYRWRTFFISSEFIYTKTAEGPITLEERRFYIKLSKPLTFYRRRA